MKKIIQSYSGNYDFAEEAGVELENFIRHYIEVKKPDIVNKDVKILVEIIEE